MISFKIINADNREEIIKELCSSIPGEAETVNEIIFGLDLDGDNDIEYGICLFLDCIILRIFDMGRYLFVFPYAVCEDADLRGAIDAVGEYAMREEISLTFCDVPCECLSLFSGYRHMDVDAEDEEGECYRVRIKRESDLIDEVPEAEHGRVKLNALSEADIADYAALCKDKNVNKYWGYDYSEDVHDPSDRYFYENAHLEFVSGASVSFAIKYEDRFIGEAIIYAFDGKGSAEFAIRLLPAFHGMGLGREGVRAICNAARKLGLIKLYSKVMKDNLPSVGMLKKVTDESDESNGFITFTIYLN
jgi:RimJ/RimL family protein N-acetyltransferase